MIWRTGLRSHSTPSVLPCDSPVGSSGKKASLSSFTPSPGDLSRRTRELRKVPCNVHFVHSSGFAYAVLFSIRITYGSSGEQAIFPGFSRSGKCDSRERSESERRRSVIPICESKSMEGPPSEAQGFSPWCLTTQSLTAHYNLEEKIGSEAQGFSPAGIAGIYNSGESI